jgi:hypothetical protein
MGCSCAIAPAAPALLLPLGATWLPTRPELREKTPRGRARRRPAAARRACCSPPGASHGRGIASMLTLTSLYLGSKDLALLRSS